MKNLTLLILFLLFTGVPDVRAADSLNAEERLELRQRLDSLEVEKQTLKRLGKPLVELEEAASQLRDTLSAMRPQSAPLEQPASSDKSFSLPFSLSGIPFEPRNFFDWFIIAVGVVALLSGFLLIMNIFHAARVKKRRAAAQESRSKTKPVSKRMNLAPQENHGAAPTSELPKISPSYASTPPPQTAPPAFGGYDFAGRQNGHLKTEAYNRQDTLSDDKTISLLRERIRNAPAPEQRTAAPPLFVNAGQPPPAPLKTAPSAASATAQSAHELVAASSREGLSAQEISKRHQISIDQVNLILRMEKSKRA